MARRLASTLLIVLVAAAGWWAGRATLVPDRSGDDNATSAITAGVVEASVGRSIPVGVTLTQPVRLIAANQLPGVVTAVNADGPYEVGATIYAVAGIPVRVVAGPLPFYRPLAPGAEGDDVRQLQQALRELGYSTATPTGRYTAGTQAAARAWQRDLGMPATGDVALGELVAVPTLPAVLTLGDAVRLGAVLSGGEEALLGGTGEQRFSVVLSDGQAQLITDSTVIEVRHDSGVWAATVTGSTVDDTGNTVLSLAGVDGGPVCGSDCATLPGGETVNLRGEAVIVPTVTGPAVPVAAVRTSTDGAGYVLRADGEQAPVTVLGSGQGMAVVEGLSLGDEVLVSEAGTMPSNSAGPGETGGG